MPELWYFQCYILFIFVCLLFIPFGLGAIKPICNTFLRCRHQLLLKGSYFFFALSLAFLLYLFTGRCGIDLHLAAGFGLHRVEDKVNSLFDSWPLIKELLLQFICALEGFIDIFRKLIFWRIDKVIHWFLIVMFFHAFGLEAVTKVLADFDPLMVLYLGNCGPFLRGKLQNLHNQMAKVWRRSILNFIVALLDVLLHLS